MNKTNNSSKTAKKIMAGLLILSFGTMLNAKDKKGVIMTVDGEDVPTEEFVYLFQKNNQQQSQSQDLEEYLPLFEVYRLKVAEAKSAGIDTTENFKKEMESYRRELLEPYVADTVYFNQLVEEAVARENTLVESSHIMIVRTNDKAIDERSLQLLDSLRQELLNGADFIEMAKEYSQDKFSSAKGGYLGFAPAGTFPYGFETAVYETPEGEISDIVESHVGWHIVKSGARKSAEEFNKPEKNIDEIRADVARKSSSPFDVRYHELRKRQLENLKAKHPELSENLANLTDEEALALLIATEEESQYMTNPEYRNLVDEYVNGSLLYEVSVGNVWDKASNDEEGLQAFFDKNKNNYPWSEPHAKGILIQTTNDSVAQVLKSELKEMPLEDVVSFVKTNHKGQAVAERFNAVKGMNPMIDNLMFDGEAASPRTPKYKEFFIVYGKVIDQPEELNDVRSQVVVDYQEELEREWIENLRKKHSVEINKKELNRVKKAIK